jgi:integrase
MASPKKTQPAAPRRFRDKWPFITWYAPRECYVVDTRVGGQGVGGKRHFCKTLAEAENIATAAANLRDAHGTASYHNDELAQYGLTIQDAVTAQLKLLRAARAPKPLQEALEEFRESKLREGLRANSLKAVLWEITRFVDETGPGIPVAEISIAQLEAYLKSSLTPGTFNTRRKHLVTFLNFALKRGWIEKNHALNISLRIERYEVHILTPEQVARLLLACDVLQEPARSSMRAYIALAAFAGIRPEELHRLNWRDIDLEHNTIYIGKSVSKVNDDRNVPITENLRAWLLSIEHRTGVIAPASSFRRRFNTIRPVAGFRTWKCPKGDPWHHDVLRHTYGSCWLAIHQNRPLLAEHMGNSVRIITKHYKRMVSRGQADAWFGVFPPANDKIIPIGTSPVRP